MISALPWHIPYQRFVQSKNRYIIARRAYCVEISKNRCASRVRCLCVHRPGLGIRHLTLFRSLDLEITILRDVPLSQFWTKNVTLHV